jgi:hypothetical protein
MIIFKNTKYKAKKMSTNRLKAKGERNRSPFISSDNYLQYSTINPSFYN